MSLQEQDTFQFFSEDPHKKTKKKLSQTIDL